MVIRTDEILSILSKLSDESGLKVTVQESVKLSGSNLAVIRQSSGSHQTVIRQSSDSHLTVVYL